LKTSDVWMVILVAFAILLITLPSASVAGDKNKTVEPVKEIESTDKNSETEFTTISAYYFHGRKRCMSCKTIEMYSHDALLKFFPKRVETGQIEWKVANYLDPKNKKFKKEFGLFTQSVVFFVMNGEEIVRWKNLKDVWEHKKDKEKFYDYVKVEMDTFIAEGK